MNNATNRADIIKKTSWLVPDRYLIDGTQCTPTLYQLKLARQTIQEWWWWLVIDDNDVFWKLVWSVLVISSCIQLMFITKTNSIFLFVFQMLQFQCLISALWKPLNAACYKTSHYFRSNQCKAQFKQKQLNLQWPTLQKSILAPISPVRIHTHLSVRHAYRQYKRVIGDNFMTLQSGFSHWTGWVNKLICIY